ncbi:hypothetical protein L6452_01872 [Arctium lappa]|uniref:Uncharacterized protein n=1 Tax=Arctium lappa TaxID=4217 RepID=A0ACB9FHJ1_ARCLA|nr:hypothetical protein L6452_01872 [Arctium lappa]
MLFSASWVGNQDEKLGEGIKLYAIPTTSTSKRTMLSDLVTVYAKGGKTIVFTQTKRDADKRDVGCKFEFTSPPAVEEILDSSAEQVVATLSGVHPESVEFFIPTTQKLIDEQTGYTGSCCCHCTQIKRFKAPFLIFPKRLPGDTAGNTITKISKGKEFTRWRWFKKGRFQWVPW